MPLNLDLSGLTMDKKREKKSIEDSQVNVSFNKDRSKILRQIFKEHAGPVLHDFIIEVLTGVHGVEIKNKLISSSPNLKLDSMIESE
jgi:hypothetical protein